MIYKKTVGQFGEELAQKFLIKKGYTIIDANTKVSFKEIDIVARIKNTVVFVEVKTRTTKKFGEAVDAITDAKTDNLKKAVSMYLESHKYPKDCGKNNFRIDLIAVDINIDKKTAKIRFYEDII
jgi:putative endonuclease